MAARIRGVARDGAIEPPNPMQLEAPMTFLLPSERVDGTAAECTHLRLLFACFRASPPPMRLPQVAGSRLPVLLESGVFDKDVFQVGYAIMASRYERLGVYGLLPLERVWAGTRSAAAPGGQHSWGGFHHPAQGYRHIQMDAAVTAYGDLTGKPSASPQSAALDLVRSYAHDCLHYATFRRYRLSDRGEVVRVQYGINFRQPDGRTYSAPDMPGNGPTRNLGIVMEGATDAEARAIARETAGACGITVMDPEPDPHCAAFADTTGTLTADAIDGALSSAYPYLRSLGQFHGAVTGRYCALLRELSGDSGELHVQFLMAMISGELPPLEAWLDARHGPDCFARLFRAPSFVPVAELVS
jgi:hypothetical protein